MKEALSREQIGRALRVPDEGFRLGVPAFYATEASDFRF